MLRVSFVCADGCYQQSQGLPQSSWLSSPPRKGPSCILLCSFHSTLCSPENRCSLICSCSCEVDQPCLNFMESKVQAAPTGVQCPCPVFWYVNSQEFEGRHPLHLYSTDEKRWLLLHLDLLKSIMTSFFWWCLRPGCCPNSQMLDFLSAVCLIVVADALHLCSGLWALMSGSPFWHPVVY